MVYFELYVSHVYEVACVNGRCGRYLVILYDCWKRSRYGCILAPVLKCTFRLTLGTPYHIL